MIVLHDEVVIADSAVAHATRASAFGGARHRRVLLEEQRVQAVSLVDGPQVVQSGEKGRAGVLAMPIFEIVRITIRVVDQRYRRSRLRLNVAVIRSPRLVLVIVICLLVFRLVPEVDEAV